jgi:hypothetical protein
LVRSVGEECVTDSELRNLVAKKPGFVLYDGFEPSGRMHIAQVAPHDVSAVVAAEGTTETCQTSADSPVANADLGLRRISCFLLRRRGFGIRGRNHGCAELVVQTLDVLEFLVFTIHDSIPNKIEFKAGKSESNNVKVVSVYLIDSFSGYGNRDFVDFTVRQ